MQKLNYYFSIFFILMLITFTSQKLGANTYSSMEPNSNLIIYSSLQDGKFLIESIEAYPNNKICIFDTKGNQIIFMEHYKNNWDGKIDDKELSGMYYYVLEDGLGHTNAGYLYL